MTPHVSFREENVLEVENNLKSCAASKTNNVSQFKVKLHPNYLSGKTHTSPVDLKFGGKKSDKY